MYYRVYDQQTGTYFATGYNSESMPEVISSFQSYILNGGEDMTPDMLSTWPDIAEYLQDVELEESETPFEDDNNF